LLAPRACDLLLSLFSLSFLSCVHSSSSSCAWEAWDVYFQPNSCYKIFSWKWFLLCKKLVTCNNSVGLLGWSSIPVVLFKKNGC
jgi:hypothetical protein